MPMGQAIWAKGVPTCLQVLFFSSAGTFRADTMVQLIQSLYLDLANSFAGQSIIAANFLQRTNLITV
jgi:hypothetical protein